VISLCSVITAATADTAAAVATAEQGPTVIASWGQFQESRYTATAVPPTTDLPVGVEASALAAGGDFAMALGSDGAVYTWGYNAAGELGTAQALGSLTPIFDPVRVVLPNGATATSIAASSTGGLGPGRAFAVGSDGVAYYWGARDYCHSANTDVPVALPLPAGVRAREVAGNALATFVLGDDGNVYSTGNNYLGNLGTGSTESQDCTPSRVALPSGVTATAIDAGSQFALAVGSDGHLYAWGDNSQGQLGMGFTTGGDQSTPVWVRIPDGAPTAIAAGNAHGLAVGSDGRLYGWGENAFGAVGDGSTLDRTAPVPVGLPDGVTPTAIAANNQSLALGSDGRLYGWGYNYNGELGDTATTTRLTPQPVALPDGARTEAIAAGVGFTLALVDAIAPQFTRATPPTTATAGSSLDYTFGASGLPAPSYRLADAAPSWLHIDASSGELTGTLPSDASTFSFSVTATNLAGTATAGPFTVTVPLHPVEVSGTVDGAGRPVADALVDVCVAGGSVCQHATTDGNGAFTVMMTPNTAVEVTAYPPQGSGLDTGTSGELFVPTSGLDAVAVHLPALTTLGAGISVTSGQVGTTAGGQPVFHWTQAATLRASNCANGTGVMTLVGENTSTGQYEYHAYPLTEDPAGSGGYTGTLPPQYPIHGPVEIKQTVTCAGQPGVEPQSGLTTGGESITISGTGVGGATAVQFGTVAATDLQSVSDDLLTVTAPPGSGTVPVEVTLASGDTVPAGEYTYVAANDVPNLDQASYRAATDITTAAGPAPQAQVQPESAGAVRLTAHSATPLSGLLADTSSNSDTLATIAKWVYKNFPGGEAATLRSAIATAMLAMNPTCDSDRAALKAAVHLAVAAAVLTVVADISPLLVVGAEALLSALVDPIIAALLEPAVAFLVAKLVGVILNKMIDAMLDAAIDAALGRCPDHQTNALIDPSGTVLDTNGNPVSGATVTILRSDAEAGPFTVVDVTQPGIEPATNPETTAADGVFHWDVRSGYYEVRARKTGCTVPGHADQDTATTGPLPVPPPQVGLTITLACPDELPPPTPTVNALTVATGPPAGGTDVVVSGSGFTPAATVTVGGVAATNVTYLGPNALEFNTPAHSVGPADVVVHTAGGDSATSGADQFSYGTVPVVTGLSVTSGPATGGTVVTITGSGFTGAEVVGFGGMPGSDLSVISDTQLTVTTPAVSAGGAVDVKVVTPIGANSPGDPARFTYIDVPAPVCSAVTATARPKRDTTVQLSCTGEGVVYDLPGQPEHGTLSDLDAATGTITYTAAAKYVGTDTFTYTAHNAGGTSVPVTVTLTVTHRNTGNHGKSGSHRNSGNKGGNAPGDNQVTPR
jgi:alpha-tubulin suppressor-like RCC1 family protein/protocatechuate 3,4-dioxygenase beta subunit